MSVKLGRVVFRKIGGRIVPIREGIKLANAAVSQLGDEVLKAASKAKGAIKKIGSGVDFNVFKSKTDDIVMKLPKLTKGTSNPAFLKRFPHTSDKLAVSKVLSENLPNYGFPTVETDIVRISKSKRALVQEFIKKNSDYIPDRNANTYLQRESEKLLKEHGLNIDAHAGNLAKGSLIDTGGNLKKSRVKDVARSSTAKEILGIENHWGSTLKDYFNKSKILTETAALEGQSGSALRRVNALKKKGYRLKSDDGSIFKLLSPEQRIERAKNAGVVFKKVNGKIIPSRVKK